MKRVKNLGRYLEMGYVIGIFFVALYLRMWWIKNVKTYPIYDFRIYQEIAVNIFWRAGFTLDGQPIAFQGMGYPVVLGCLYRLVGNIDLMTAKYFNVFLSMGTLVCVYFILIKMTKRKFVVYTAYTIVAMLPNYIAYTNVIGTEVFFTFIFSVLILLQVYTCYPLVRFGLLGIFIGIATLTKPFFMVYPIVVGVIYWLKSKDIKRAMLQCITLTFIMAMVVAPWTYRNYKKFGRLIPVSYNGGYVLHVNNNGYNTTGSWMKVKDTDASEEAKQQIKNILEHEDIRAAHEIELIAKKEAKEWIRKNPGEFLKLGVLRIKETFFHGSWDIDAWTMNDKEDIEKEFETWDKRKQSYHVRNENFTKAMRDMIVYVLSSFGIMYLLVSVKTIIKAFFKKEYKLKDEMVVPVMNSAFFMVVYFVCEGQTRYNFPLLFLFAMSTAIVMDRVMRSFERREEL